MIDNAVAFHNERRRLLDYRIYMTDAAKVIAENTARAFGGKMLTVRYADLYSKKETEPKETAGEIIVRMKDKINAMGGDD